MIKLKNLLTETRSTEIDIQSAIKYIKNINIPFNDILEKRIYRGNEHLWEDFYYIDPKSSTRISAYTNNYYTLCMDNFPEWEKFPKRSTGIICSNNTDGTKIYGNTYRVIPLSENAKIGICPECDIWESFSINLGSLNDDLEHGFKIVNKYLSKNDNPNIETKNNIKVLAKMIYSNLYTYTDLVEAFHVVDKYKSILWEDLHFCYDEIFTKNDNCLTSYKNFLDPSRNGFKLKTYNTYYSNYGSSNEVWLDSECLLIKNDIISEFKNHYDTGEKYD